MNNIYWLLAFLIALSFLIIILNIVFYFQKKDKNKKAQEFKEKMHENFSSISTLLNLNYDSINKLSEALIQKINNFNQNIIELINNKMIDLIKEINNGIKEIQQETKTTLNDLEKNNNLQLAKIKEEMDAHFESKLSKQLQEHFTSINQSMNDLTNNLQKVETVDKSLEKLNRTFNDPKVRGIFGEISLQKILTNNLSNENVLWKSQVNLSKLKNEHEVEIKNEIVDFVVEVISKKNEKQFLPIDSKFPIEAYNKIFEANSKEELKKLKKQFKTAIKSQAESISKKYLKQGITTDYAIMFLPSDSIYAQAVEDGEFNFELQNKYKVFLAGPSTITFFINHILLQWKNFETNKHIGIIQELLDNIQKKFANIKKYLDNSKNKAQKIIDDLTTANNLTDTITKISNKINPSVTKALTIIEKEEE
ncbi:DNA recombination protein RmuC [Mycoplasma phocimorsus]|uniref:DNA recombination protein RmuC n=1 Tax=Mycoplasma phocimorsus TaxID=3045839 RepID=UPI0024BF4B48|nr:DNA recombination protein RmuC [Mycoplasma phocimorsus]MDJ1647478.1 DNA recombination protein RmuC [Mycoplasma phocimorsus]